MPGKIALAILAAGYMLSLVLLPQLWGSGVRQAVTLCLESVVPSLFLFICACSFLRRTGLAALAGRRLGFLTRPFRLPPSAAPALLLGLICGFPVGAQEISEMKLAGRLTKKQAEIAIPLCSAPSAAFCAAFIGAGLFSSPLSGLIIWGTGVLSSLAVCFSAARLTLKKPAPSDRAERAGQNEGAASALTGAVTESAKRLFSVCALIVFFSSAATVLSPLLPDGYPGALITGAIEMTCGLARLSGLPGAAAAAGAICCFGGMSVTAQSFLFAKKAELSLLPYLCCRAAAAALCAILLLIFSPFFI